jgi:hypothetical protein
MEKKNYKLSFLYDSGIEEVYDTGELTEKELKKVLDVPYESFMKGLDAVLQVPNGKGFNAYINVTKVTRVSVLP